MRWKCIDLSLTQGHVINNFFRRSRGVGGCLLYLHDLEVRHLGLGRVVMFMMVGVGVVNM